MAAWRRFREASASKPPSLTGRYPLIERDELILPVTHAELLHI